MKKIRVGMVGCGFVSELHMYAFRRVYGVDVEVRAVAARGERVVEFARRHQIPTAYRGFAELIADREIDVGDEAGGRVRTGAPHLAVGHELAHDLARTRLAHG